MDQPSVGNALDFGCGKLRYASELAARSAALTLVDSEEQLSRVQLLCGEPTTVRDYVRRHWPHGRVLSTNEFARHACRYDFVLCANVLPVIANRRVRAAALRSISDRLNVGGRCLFVCQYRNSYFTMIPDLPSAKPHLDGWLVLRDGSASSYFGFLPRDRVERIVSHCGFAVTRSWIEGQSAYVLCTRDGRNGRAPG